MVKGRQDIGEEDIPSVIFVAVVEGVLGTNSKSTMILYDGSFQKIYSFLSNPGPVQIQ